MRTMLGGVTPVAPPVSNLIAADVDAASDVTHMRHGPYSLLARTSGEFEARFRFSASDMGNDASWRF